MAATTFSLKSPARDAPATRRVVDFASQIKSDSSPFVSTRQNWKSKCLTFARSWCGLLPDSCRLELPRTHLTTMSKLRDSYIKSMRRQFGQVPLWPPTLQLELGDFGFLVDGKFELRGNLFDTLGVERLGRIRLPDANAPRISYLIRSANSTSMQSKVKAQGNDDRFDVKIDISFRSEAGFVIQLFQTASEALVIDKIAVDAVRAAYEEKQWDEGYRLIRSRVTAKYVKFAYTTNKSASIQLTASTQDEKAGIANLELGVSASSNMNADLWQVSGTATPLVELSSFSRKRQDIRPALALWSGFAVAPEHVSDEPILTITNEDSFPEPLIGFDIVEEIEHV